MAGTTVFTYTVKGTGAFPLDMLRYDSAYPAHPEDVAALETERGRARAVTLRSLSGPPTVGRWESFGWHVIQSETLKSGRVQQRAYGQIHHRDGDPRNNDIGNLEIISPIENVQ